MTALAFPSVFLVIFVMVSLVGFLSTAPANPWHFLEKYGLGSSNIWTAFDETSVSGLTTTPAPIMRPELECEQKAENLKKTVPKDMEVAIRILVSEYDNWGKFLAPAPMAIDILGQFILMANQINDFSINSEDPSEIFKHIQQTNNFRTSLRQISHRGYNAFLKAYRNMAAIRVHNREVTSVIKDAIRYLASENSKIIYLRLSRTLDKINEVARKSQELSKEVVDEFNLVLELIEETELTLSRLRYLKSITGAKTVELSVIENSLLAVKIANLEEIMDQLEHYSLPASMNDGSKQLVEFISMKKTMLDIFMVEKELTRIEREKNTQTHARSTSSFIKIKSESSVSRALGKLYELKNDWGNVIRFFGTIRTFIEFASRHSSGFVHIVYSLSENAAVNMRDEFLFNHLAMNFEKSSEAVLLVHGIANMYANVHNGYIFNLLNKLNTMNSMRVKGVSDEQLKKLKENITMDATEASKGIEKYIKIHEIELKDTLNIRHEEINREFRNMILCTPKIGVTDLAAMNFTAYYYADVWFQIKYRMNGKAMEVSSESPNVVQMWESHGGDNQLWYTDYYGAVRSVTNGFCLTSNGLTKHITTDPCQDDNINQKWTVIDGMIINVGNPYRCLDIHNKDDANGARINEVNFKDTVEELWKIV